MKYTLTLPRPVMLYVQDKTHQQAIRSTTQKIGTEVRLSADPLREFHVTDTGKDELVLPIQIHLEDDLLYILVKDLDAELAKLCKSWSVAHENGSFIRATQRELAVGRSVMRYLRPKLRLVG